MQVRKFEAKTIKEAIELVKLHMGPDAIILSAKDNNKSFGLMGASSVEVTAAVSDTKLMQKKQAEKKLDPVSRKKYLSARASTQKAYIEKAHENDNSVRLEEELKNAKRILPNDTAMANIQNVVKSDRITTDRYIDIMEDGSTMSAPTVAQTSVAPALASFQQSSTPSTDTNTSEKIIYLQKEIQYLQNMLTQFQKVPQNFLNLHPGAEEGLPYELSFMFKKLLDAGLSKNNIISILQAANEILPAEHKKKKPFVDGWVIKYLLDRIQITEKPFKNKLHVFVGPTGQGKTSTVVKTACHLMLKEKKKIAILSADHVKVGATDQIKIYSQILNVPCGMIRGPRDWDQLGSLIDRVDYVLLDTPGVNLRSPLDLDLLRGILPGHIADKQVHYVQSIMARDTDAFEIADRFQIIGFDDVIFTRLDEAVQHGIIYNFQKKFDIPIHSFGIGNVIPDDFELATKERVIDLIFNLTKIRKERGG